ncbi:hypothetical protein [Variovorax sp. GT1P44]|uniref:hypothetical protein n=1 Tax=Variovorax sp. GT1P44 TaxID=3443742 RepID=UPI003F4840A6
MKRFLTIVAWVLAWGACAWPSAAMAQQPLVITALAERKVAELPAGQLYWRIENFPSVAQAQGAANAWALVAEAEGKVWLFTLGPAGGSSAGGVKVAEVGPIPRVAAPQYLLRINEASGPPGSTTPVHSHPGNEAFLVLTGEQSIRGPDGLMRVKAGQPEPGHGGGMPMQVSSSGSTDLRALVMFVLDATQPFSSPAKF